MNLLFKKILYLYCILSILNATNCTFLSGKNQLVHLYNEFIAEYDQKEMIIDLFNNDYKSFSNILNQLFIYKDFLTFKNFNNTHTKKKEFVYDQIKLEFKNFNNICDLFSNIITFTKESSYNDNSFFIQIHLLNNMLEDESFTKCVDSKKIYEILNIILSNHHSINIIINEKINYFETRINNIVIFDNINTIYSLYMNNFELISKIYEKLLTIKNDDNLKKINKRSTSFLIEKENQIYKKQKHLNTLHVENDLKKINTYLTYYLSTNNRINYEYILKLEFENNNIYYDFYEKNENLKLSKKLMEYNLNWWNKNLNIFYNIDNFLMQLEQEHLNSLKTQFHNLCNTCNLNYFDKFNKYSTKSIKSIIFRGNKEQKYSTTSSTANLISKSIRQSTRRVPLNNHQIIWNQGALYEFEDFRNNIKVKSTNDIFFLDYKLNYCLFNKYKDIKKYEDFLTSKYNNEDFENFVENNLKIIYTCNLTNYDLDKIYFSKYYKIQSFNIIFSIFSTINDCIYKNNNSNCFVNLKCKNEDYNLDKYENIEISSENECKIFNVLVFIIKYKIYNSLQILLNIKNNINMNTVLNKDYLKFFDHYLYLLKDLLFQNN